MTALKYLFDDLNGDVNEWHNHRDLQPHVHFLLNDLRSPINIGKCARVAEIYGMDLYIHDPVNLTGNPSAALTISDFACGGWERRTPHIVDSVFDFVQSYKRGRLVATCLRNEAIRLPEFEFAENDLIMFGNEYDGLPAELIERADAMVYIPMPRAYLPKPPAYRPIDPSHARNVNQNGIPNLNVAVAAGIVGYAYSCWLENLGMEAFSSERAMG